MHAINYIYKGINVSPVNFCILKKGSLQGLAFALVIDYNAITIFYTTLHHLQ